MIHVKQGTPSMMDVSAAIVPMNNSLHFRTEAHKEILRVAGPTLQNEAIRGGIKPIGTVLPLYPKNTPYQKVYLCVAFPHPSVEIRWDLVEAALRKAVVHAVSEGHKRIGIPFFLDAPHVALPLTGDQVASVMARVADGIDADIYLFATTDHERAFLDKVAPQLEAASEAIQAQETPVAPDLGLPLEEPKKAEKPDKRNQKNKQKGRK